MYKKTVCILVCPFLYAGLLNLLKLTFEKICCVVSHATRRSLGIKRSSGGKMRHVLFLQHHVVKEKKKRVKVFVTFNFILLFW